MPAQAENNGGLRLGSCNTTRDTGSHDAAVSTRGERTASRGRSSLPARFR